MDNNLIKIRTVYDNIDFNKNFKSDWGFGCIVDHPFGRILFDTGDQADVLEANLKTASINPDSIDIIIISHKHHDHYGGASWLLQQNPRAKVFIPQTCCKKLDKQLRQLCPNIFRVKHSMPLDPANNLFLILSENSWIKQIALAITLSNFFWIKELSLAIKTSQGAIVITGCSHTGVQQIVANVKKQTGLKIHALFGGFHLLQTSIKKIKQIADSLKQIMVKNIAPCHCTGTDATNILKTEFADNFLTNGVGAEFVFKE